MSFLYFAYGSNMLPARLTARCPSAHVVGSATTQGFDLEFSKPSKDGSGKATLVSSVGLVTPGAVFEINRNELDALDRAEGAGYGYDRVEELTVELNQGGESITATTYIADLTDQLIKPFDWYLALVIAGAHHHAFDDPIIDKLRLVQHIIDDNHNRKSRSEALSALSSHAYHDHSALLRKTA